MKVIVSCKGNSPYGTRCEYNGEYCRHPACSTPLKTKIHLAERPEGCPKMKEEQE